jgi:hypothetical protein
MFTDISEERAASVFRIEDSSTTKMEAEYFLKMSVSIYQSTRPHFQEDNNLHSRRRSEIIIPDARSLRVSVLEKITLEGGI